MSAYYIFIRSQQRNLPDFMYFIHVNILGSQCAHSTNDLVCSVGLNTKYIKYIKSGNFLS